MHIQPPPQNSNVRVDTGVASGDAVSVHYDPMIAKLVVHASDRPQALKLLIRSLEQYQVVGVHTNIEFVKRICMNESFSNGEVETGFIKVRPPPPPITARNTKLIC